MSRAALSAVLVLGLAGVAMAQRSPGNDVAKAKKAHHSFLKDTELDAGILRVNAYLGEPERPLVHVVISVHPLAGGEPLQARTSAKGVATIGNLKPGAKYRVEATINNEKFTTSDFTMPTDAGLGLSLSPVAPPSGDNAGESGDGRPPPSRMHGMSRGQNGDPAGTLTVRVVRDSWNVNAVGVKVHLVGYSHTGEMIHKTAVTDGGGRVQFSKLGRSRNTAYYVFAVAPRPNKDDATLASKPAEQYDRVTSRTVMMLPKVGKRMVLSLSGPKDADLAYDNNVDTYGDRTWNPLPAGEVHVFVQGGSNSPGKLELLQVGGKDVVAVATAKKMRPQARNIRMGRSGVVPDGRLPAGVAVIRVSTTRELMQRGRQPRAIPTVSAQLIDATTNQPVPGNRRGPDTVFRNLKPNTIYTWKVMGFGQTFEGKPFELDGKRGVFIPVPIDFDVTSQYQGVFKGVPGSADAVYYVRAKRGGNTYYSRPFQLTPSEGGYAEIDIAPRLRYRFQMGGEVDDNRIIFQGQFLLLNTSWFPYMPKGGKYIIDLPKGYKGETVHDGMDAVVKKARGRGFAWVGAIPPRGVSFSGAWLIPTDEGKIRFDLDLPNGAVASSVRIKNHEGMKVKLYGNTQGKMQEDRSGTKWFTLSNLNIPPGTAMVMDITGLPKPPAYKKYLRWSAGFVVLAILLAGILGLAWSRRGVPSAEATLTERREELLDELVTIERDHNSGDMNGADYSRRKAALIEELEIVYAALEQDDSAKDAAAR